MKKIIFITSLLLCCSSLISCNQSAKQTTANSVNNPVKTPDSQTEVNINSTPTTEPEIKESKKPKKALVKKSPSNDNKPTKTKQPKTGTIKQLVNGDLLCYVTLTDDQGKETQVGASFEICAEEKKFLNQKVRLFYTIESVNDCESAEPCGKTRKESIVTKMEIIENKPSTSTTGKGRKLIKKSSNQELNNNSKKTTKNTQTISNGKWTITTGNHDSWKGVNNTGNISYKGCDSNGKCLELTGGKITCRDGKCITGWVNKDYVYTLEDQITEDGKSSPILTVRKGDREILKETGFKAVDR